MLKKQVYNGGVLPEVVISGEDRLKQKLLNTPGWYLHANPGYFRMVMKYMRSVGDVKAEQKIFMKCFSYANREASRQVLLVAGGITAIGFAPALAANAPTLLMAGRLVRMGQAAFKLYKATTFWRMGINAGTQALIREDGWRDIDCISVISEAFNPFITALTTTIEIRPFQKKTSQQLKIAFYNKDMPEVIFDMGTSALWSSISRQSNSFVKKQLGNEMNVKLTNRLLNNVAFPIYYSGSKLTTEIFNRGVKVKYKIGENGESEEK